MTIFVSNNVDKKEDSDKAPPEVLGEVKVCLCGHCDNRQLATVTARIPRRRPVAFV